MSMSPRLLRPAASGFSPRSISGLALWLDASSSDTLYTTDAGPVTAVASPLDIAGCVGWWDASDAATLFAADTGDTLATTTVGRWANKVSGGSDKDLLQYDSTKRPTITANSIGEMQSIVFDGVNDALVRSFTLDATCHLFFVMKWFSAFASIKRATDGADGNTLSILRTSNTVIGVIGTVPTSLAGTGNSLAPLIVEVRRSTSGRFAINGAGQSEGSLGTTAPNGLTLGSFAGGGNAFDNVGFAEVIAFSDPLSVADAARVSAYLAAKWSFAGVHAAATASSDPVGYWGDKSGNGRHAVQATAANRPTVGSSSTAGKNAVRNNGTGSVALQVAAWPYTAGNTQFAVFNGSAINQAIYQRGSLNDEPRMAIQGATIPALNATRGGTLAAQTHSGVGYPLAQWSIGATLFNTALGRAYRDGVYGADTTDSQTFSGDQELRLLSLPSNIYGLNGGIAEFLYWDRQLTATEVSRVAAYLSRRWGITLAPQVSNADAQDWINRVYANGGTVSSATAAVVNQFCESIASAGIRDRFYRLNLFCGSNLNAALVPLYRGRSLGGTQYGNTTDTNNAFVGVGTDYAETGTSGGLQGNGSTKYLNTGLPGNAITAGDRHISAYENLRDTNAYRIMLGTQDDAGGTYYHSLGNGSPGSTVTYTFGLGVSDTSQTTGGHWVGTDPTGSTAVIYKNGASLATSANEYRTQPGVRGILVFATNQVPGSVLPANHYAGRLNAYSIGLGMTAPQAAAYYTAMQAFQTALGRNV